MIFELGVRSIEDMIEAINLTKRHGSLVAVDDVSFTVSAGSVTGFLGPNGAGKSSTMRMIVGLDAPTSGSVTVNGHRYADSGAPLGEVGVLLDAKAMHPARTARNHLRVVAHSHGISERRVDEVIGMTGLDSVAKKKVGQFSLGMGQRLGIATALLGDPGTLILDEPVNGLDPEGVIWVRNLCRSLAAEGRAILLSSHLMSEMAQTADRVIVLGQGRVIADASVEDLLNGSGLGKVRLRTDESARLGDILRPSGGTTTQLNEDTMEVVGLTSEQIARAAAPAGILLFELTPVQASLEDAFFDLTADSVEYRAGS